jgi:putative spermidine/putrescine transport system ATP-binding protein
MKKIEKLQIKGLTRRFGNTTALHDFDLEIDGGQFITLLGPSGCGKSTALNCLAGLLELSAGEILLNGTSIQHVSAEKRGFGMVFQNYALFPHLTAQRNVSYGLEIRGVPKAERERRVKKALELVHLPDFGKRYPAQMSGGQQQRLAIARTIVLEPGMLLLDEPLSNLDTNLRNELRIEIKRLHNELGLTTLYVTHDQSEAMSLSDRVVVMQLGHIEQIGSPQDIYNHPRSLFVAKFMGYLNQFSVIILGKDGDHWQVQAPNGTRLTARSTSDESAHWQDGQRVIACCRPDETVAQLEPAVNHLRGRVQLVEYMGRSYESLVQLEDASGLQLLVQSAQIPENDAVIDFGIQTDRLLLFPDPDAQDSSPASSYDIVEAATQKAEK